MVQNITKVFHEQMLPMPPRVKIHDTHYDFNYGEIEQIDYFPFCHEIYYDWLICHAMHIHQATFTQLQQTVSTHQVSLNKYGTKCCTHVKMSMINKYYLVVRSRLLSQIAR